MRKPKRSPRRNKKRGSAQWTNRQLERMIAALYSSVQSTVTRAEAVLEASAEIGEAARSTYRSEVVKSLADEGVLGALDRLVASDANGEATGTFRGVLVGWLMRQFD